MTELRRKVTAVFLSVTSDTERSGSTKPGTMCALIAGNRGSVRGSRPLELALILVLFAVLTIRLLCVGLSRVDVGGTSVSLVPECTLSLPTVDLFVLEKEVADLAIDSE